LEGIFDCWGTLEVVYRQSGAEEQILVIHFVIYTNHGKELFQLRFSTQNCFTKTVSLKKHPRY
jgi:hypothetical protein